MARISYELRAALCEILIGWAMAVSPKGYVPSTVEVAVRFYEHGLKKSQDR